MTRLAPASPPDESAELFLLAGAGLGGFSLLLGMLALVHLACTYKRRREMLMIKAMRINETQRVAALHGPQRDPPDEQPGGLPAPAASASARHCGSRV